MGQDVLPESVVPVMLHWEMGNSWGIHKICPMYQRGGRAIKAASRTVK